ncbi:M24 family metallopeptidase [Leptospira ognonensis]|uniref:Xaa-Pro aminopeptidase n=1 Tax=Leptospira ognonensis TaxID=2484945 RepID=A0A4R9JYA8_9LEPT|nr:aminopeptidase P N-terminal domain-containing protein [Leptospira ognonensis]TGL57512.1 M24 family metallopeptidase [Leptospira ognonensis]
MTVKEIDHSLFQKRIKNVQKELSDSDLLLVFAANHKIRNRDVEFKFRQDSDFYYLTGIVEADGILFISKQEAGMFCLPKDKEKEIWTGTRLGKDKIKSLLKLTKTFDISDWDTEKHNLFLGFTTLYYFFGYDDRRDLDILRTAREVSLKVREGKFGPSMIKEPQFLHELRLRKTKEEIDHLMEASRITAKGHIQIMKESKPGMYEYELEAILEKIYLENGAWGGGYGHIVATGKNACILHYVSNTTKLKESDLVLVDSGAEYNYYTADVTRVFPAGKKFTEAQKMIYEVVLASGKNAIQYSKEGTPFNEIHTKTVHFLSDCLRDMGFLSGSLESIIETGSYKKFYMHRTGHYLGMDVHDVGKYYIDGKSRKLQNGQVMTVEPGLYFDPEDGDIPKEFRGIGIRIEDDIVISGKNPINLTASIPKEISEIEALKQ